LAPSSQVSADSTSASSGPECALCGSASRTTTADESLPGIGPESLAIPTCEHWWPTPSASHQDIGPERPETFLARREKLKEKGYNGNGAGIPLGVAVQMGPAWSSEAGMRCPCRCHTSTSSAEASPAKTSATPAREPGSTGHARVFGQSTPAWLASFDPATSSWRTSQLSLLGGLDEFSGTWPRSGMTRSGTAFRLQPLAPLTAETASGLLPTPAASMAERGGRGDLLQVVRGNPSPSGHFKWPTPTARDWKDTGDLTGVPENSLLPRVVARVEREQWATPTAHPRTHTPRRVDHGEQLANQVGGALNPTWVEWLMGFPLEWTALPPSETPSSRRSRNGSAGASSTGSEQP
jgi:hypothetical protein